ncbi:MAG TPA: hypothetical protein DSN98_00205 [Thermoplasmata archaeon]|jgi:hypothetical protein|nr:MAG TPA: hypothetical protein DSN98_00205 [Thermoplasmata archaeon]
MTNNRRISIIFLTTIILGTCIASVTATDPTIGSVTITPNEPAPQSSVNFSVNIVGDGISAVYLHYKECNVQICKVFNNISMTKLSGNTYEKKIKLTWDEATYITYNFEINSNGVWTKTEYVNVSLKPVTNDDGNNTNNNKQPGFEILFFVAAVGVSVIILGRKRSR